MTWRYIGIAACLVALGLAGKLLWQDFEQRQHKAYVDEILDQYAPPCRMTERGMECELVYPYMVPKPTCGSMREIEATGGHCTGISP